jgi:hypothetical protein
MVSSFENIGWPTNEKPTPSGVGFYRYAATLCLD